MAREEVVISRYMDPEFGALELIETRTRAAVNGGPMRPLISRRWTGKLPDIGATLSISSSEGPPIVADEIRTVLRSILSDVGDFKRQVAHSQLELAKDWAAAGGIDLLLDESTFSDSLRIDGFTIGEETLTVWLEDTADIFAGHSLEVRMERGEIIEICLAG